MPDALHESDAALQRRLAAAAADFGAHAFLHERGADELVERLDALSIAPTTVADVGAATGLLARRLQRRYPGAEVFAVESCAALGNAAPAPGLAARLMGRRGPRRVTAGMAALPFDDDSIDLVASCLALPRFAQPDAALAEIARVLAPGGAFTFVTLGPATLAELREAWRSVDEGPHVAEFADMHDVGDALGRAGFAEPVLDVDTLQVAYRDVAALWRDLTALGARNCLPGRRTGLTGRRRFEAMRRALDAGSGFTISVELVFGQCWGLPAARRRGEVSIAPDAITVRRRGEPKPKS